MTTLDLEQLMVISFSSSRISLGEDDDEVDEEESPSLYDEDAPKKKINPFELVDEDNKDGGTAEGDDDVDPLVGDEDEEDIEEMDGFSEVEE